MFKKIFFITILIVVGAGFFSLSYAYQAKILSDAELDTVCAGGFDFDLGAAYAFRAGVFQQRNIIAMMNRRGRISQTKTRGSNYAYVSGQDVPGDLTQSNISAIVAQRGDIVGASMGNENVSHAHGASGVIDQVNLAVAVALQGNVHDLNITNANMAAASGTGPSSKISETNISVIVAGGNIHNVNVHNSNTIHVSNVSDLSKTTHISSLPNGMLVDLTVSQSAAQKNLTLAISGYTMKNLVKGSAVRVPRVY